MTIPDVAPYRAYWRKLAEKKPTPEQRAAARRARREAKRLAKILAEEFGAKRVYLFGSFAWSVAWTRPDSDLDLAVEGLPSGQWLKAVVRLERATRYEFNLEKLESTTMALRDFVLKFGLLLYDANHQPRTSASTPERGRKAPARTNRGRRVLR